MTELERLKQSFQQSRIDRTTRLVEQCVSPNILREFHNFLTVRSGRTHAPGH